MSQLTVLALKSDAHIALMRCWAAVRKKRTVRSHHDGLGQSVCLKQRAAPCRPGIREHPARQPGFFALCRAAKHRQRASFKQQIWRSIGHSYQGTLQIARPPRNAVRFETCAPRNSTQSHMHLAMKEKTCPE